MHDVCVIIKQRPYDKKTKKIENEPKNYLTSQKNTFKRKEPEKKEKGFKNNILLLQLAIALYDRRSIKR